MCVWVGVYLELSHPDCLSSLAGAVAVVGHGRTGALQEPHSKLHTRLHCGCGGLRYHK